MSEDLPGLPRAAVDDWLRSALPDLVRGGPWTAELISGGLSNITYRLHLSGAETILRRPPLGGVLPSAHDMQREWKILSALAPTEVPVPEPLALCTDPGVLGYPFYVMRAVPGETLRTAQDTAALTVAQRAAVSSALIDALAQLHAVDVEAVGLADFGRPDGYSARLLKRWGQQWEKSKTRELPDMDVLIARLSERIPPQQYSTIVHGDYRLDNTIVELDEDGGARVAAVVDWELSTLGDPLADLGLALVYWHDRDDADRELIPVAAGVTAHEGFPTGAEVAQGYAERTGRDLSALPFHEALAAMKLAVILEGVHARYVGGHTVSGGYEGVGAAVPALVARGLRSLPA